jgi:hypothetical protein
MDWDTMACPALDTGDASEWVGSGATPAFHKDWDTTAFPAWDNAAILLFHTDSDIAAYLVSRTALLHSAADRLPREGSGIVGNPACRTAQPR